MRARDKQVLNGSYGEDGSIKWTVKSGTDLKGSYEYGDFIAAELKIRDCEKEVALDFASHTERAARKRLAKLNVLVDSITAMRDAYQLAITAATKQKRPY